MSLRALVVAFIAVIALPSAHAIGAKPERFYAHFLDTAQDVDVSGINVDVVSEGVFTDREFFDNDGNFLRFMSTVSGATTPHGRSFFAMLASSRSLTPSTWTPATSSRPR